MCAATWKSPDVAAGRAEAERLANAIAAEGFVVVRNKLECPLEDMMELTEWDYMECHVKLRLTPEEEAYIPFVEAATGAHVSSNRIGNPPGRRKWYLTNRRYHGTVEEARASFEETLAITQQYLPVHNMEMECAVLDSNPAIDRGWASQ
jgi:hypothetical protein